MHETQAPDKYIVQVHTHNLYKYKSNCLYG